MFQVAMFLGENILITVCTTTYRLPDWYTETKKCFYFFSCWLCSKITIV